MLQRIQTVYLGLAFILLGLMVWLPLADVSVGANVYTFSVKGIVNGATGDQLQSGLPLMVMLGIALVLQVVVIYSFKNRVRQMRLSTFNIILMLGMIGLFFYFKYASFKEMTVDLVSYRIALVFPVVAAILNYLAIRAIGKDEALVRSIDRIR